MATMWVSDFAAGGADFVGGSLRFFLGQGRQFQRGNQIGNGRSDFYRRHQNHIADHAVLLHLFGVARGAAVCAINLQALASPRRAG